MEVNKPKKNCHNCKFGQYETDGEYGEYTYFICEKREDDGYNGLEKNLYRSSYLEKAKVCCELRIDVKCICCEEVERLAENSKNYLCFPCWVDKEEFGQNNP
ncbi:hypothetical protein S349_56 [Shewanella sp. phage 3/49]|uniref:hypothetical protein n=1 Tax=Shewanella sp. phage 3/49 TaxID=1458863 RepID=UPI0004F6FAD0|nr:hypothetical protein S349_56 [Shewanella sp. phage 3/49]AHK11846.1 hypothetical protein S349_56 [Shewanella sp. phage 3/49]